MTTVELLEAARGLIANPDRWTRGELALSRLGKPIATQSREASAWCAFGALLRYDNPDRAAGDCLSDAAVELGFGSVPYLNDYSDHATVLRMFDLAIEEARKQEPALAEAVA